MTAKEKFINACRAHGVSEEFVQGCIEDKLGGDSIVVISTKTEHIMRFWYAPECTTCGMTDVRMTMADIHDCPEFIHACFNPDDSEGTPEIWLYGDADAPRRLYLWFANKEVGEFPLPLSALDCTQFLNNFDRISLDTEFEDDVIEFKKEVVPFKEDETYLMAEGARQSVAKLLEMQLEQTRKLLISEITNLVKCGWVWEKGWDFIVYDNLIADPLESNDLRFNEDKGEAFILANYGDTEKRIYLDELSAEYLLKIYSELEVVDEK